MTTRDGERQTCRRVEHSAKHVSSHALEICAETVPRGSLDRQFRLLRILVRGVSNSRWLGDEFGGVEPPLSCHRSHRSISQNTSSSASPLAFSPSSHFSRPATLNSWQPKRLYSAPSIMATRYAQRASHMDSSLTVFHSMPKGALDRYVRSSYSLLLPQSLTSLIVPNI